MFWYAEFLKFQKKDSVLPYIKIVPELFSPTRLNYLCFFSTPTIDIEPNFLRTRAGGKILFLELGVGYNTPVIIKYPFWKMTLENPNAVYASINLDNCTIPGELGRQSICIHADIGAVLTQLTSE